jgi:phospholipid transport system substrate-binding protein
MGKNREGEWKLINVVLNGINLGKTFRSQFMQAMKKQGDLNQVIAEWAEADKTVAAN